MKEKEEKKIQKFKKMTKWHISYNKCSNGCCFIYIYIDDKLKIVNELIKLNASWYLLIDACLSKHASFYCGLNLNSKFWLLLLQLSFKLVDIQVRNSWNKWQGLLSLLH